MRKMLLGVLCLVGFVLVLASCDRSVPVIEPEAEGGTIGGVAMGLTPPTNMEMSWLWSSFNVVVYPTSRVAESASCTSRTVPGPRDHSTWRIASSASVGWRDLGRGMGGDLRERVCDQSVRGILRRIS